MLFEADTDLEEPLFEDLEEEPFVDTEADPDLEVETLFESGAGLEEEEPLSESEPENAASFSSSAGGDFTADLGLGVSDAYFLGRALALDGDLAGADTFEVFAVGETGLEARVFGNALYGDAAAEGNVSN